jgi:hypothetical protein
MEEVERHGVSVVLDLLGEGVGQALVRRVNRRIPMRIVRFCRST